MGTRTAGRAEVVLATDGSLSAQWAEVWITNARWETRPEVDVVNVASPSVASSSWMPEAADEELRVAMAALRADEEAEAHGIAEAGASRLREVGFSTTATSRYGEPAVHLLERIAELRPALVAMGCRGRSEIEAMLLGSVTQQVTAHSRSAVLIARRTGFAAGTLPLQTIVVIDPATTAQSAVAWLSVNGWLRGSRVTLLGLLGPTRGLVEHDQRLIEKATTETRTHARTVIERVASRLGSGPSEVSIELRFGHPLQVCREVAVNTGADLVVLARQQQPPGSYPFAQKLARYLPTSVLLMPEN